MGREITIDLDDLLIENSGRAAADHGRSLEAELKQALAAARPRRRRSKEELLALSDRLLALTPASSAAVDSTLLIREDRDSR